MKSFIRTSNMKTQRGVALIMVTLALVVLIGFAALAIDISNLYVARNELQNAADAGALAGARALYPDDNNSIKMGVNTDAGQIAFGAANNSQNVAIEVVQNEDIKMGHWAPVARMFTELAPTTTVNLWTFKPGEPPEEPEPTFFINAIKVIKAKRAVNAFFFSSVGFESFEPASHAAVAFIGTLKRDEVDLPIAVCRSTVIAIEIGTCDVGRRIPNNTGGWTNFIQPWTPVSADDIQPLLAEQCKNAKNPNPILLGDPVGIEENIGDLITAYSDLVKCWKNTVNAVDIDNDGIPDQSDRPWTVTLPVVHCPTGSGTPQVPNNPTVLGAARIEILWMTPVNNQPLWQRYSQAPRKMDDWDCTELEKCTAFSDASDTEDYQKCISTCGEKNEDGCSGCSTSEECTACNLGCKRWCSFVISFNLKEINENDAKFAANSIYLRPMSCIIFGKPVLVE